MRQLIIDGHNTIHRIPFLKRKLDKDHEVAREALISLVQNWKFKENYTGKITIVFDGQDGLIQQYSNTGTIRVVYSGAKEKADNRILYMVRNSREKSLLTIVTCDEKDIGHICRNLGAEVRKPDFLLKNKSEKRYSLDDKKIGYKEKQDIDNYCKKAFHID